MFDCGLCRFIAKTAITRSAFSGHARKNRLATIDIVVDHHLDLVGMQTMQPSGILGKCSLPRNRHRQYQGIEWRVIEAFSYQFAGGKQDARRIRW